MSDAMSTFLFRMIVYVFASWIFYAFDRRFGKNSYRRWYNFSHEDKLPEDVSRGFVIGRPGKTKCLMATILSIAVTIFLAESSKDTALAWLFTWFCGIIAATIGFVTGPIVMNVWGKRGNVFSTIDRFEEGKINPAQSVRQAGKKLKSGFSGILDKHFKWLKEFWYGPDIIAPAGNASEAPQPISDVGISLEAEPPKTDVSENGQPPLEEVLLGEQESGSSTEEQSKPDSKGDELSPEAKIDQFTNGG
jgi:hypothetical protein